MSTPQQILDGETKAEAIRRLWNESPLQRDEIAALLDCSINYVRVQICVAARPGYKTEWMRRKRQTDKAYREREQAQQRARYRARHNTEHRA